MEPKFVSDIGIGGSGENGVETSMDFVAERLKGLLRRLNCADVDEIEPSLLSWVVLFQRVGAIGEDPGKSSARVKHDSVQRGGGCKSYRGWRLDYGIQESVHPQSQTLDVEK
jgi:hypothetical protein